MKYTIRTVTGYGDCDDCGYYSWSEIYVILDGETVTEYSYDGHLGGSEVEYIDEEDFVRGLKCGLELLGNEVVTEFLYVGGKDIDGI